jgi:hypothetical protein
LEVGASVMDRHKEDKEISLQTQENPIY